MPSNNINQNLDAQSWDDIQKAKTSELIKQPSITTAINKKKSGVISNAVILLEKIKTSVEKHLSNNLPLKKHDDLISIVANPDLLRIAFNKLSRNKGAMTPGSAGTTADGFSENKIQEISTQILSGTYKWSPIKRIMIPKPGKKVKRPLGLPDFGDKIVQEAIRNVLEAIYEPHFHKIDVNSGFRPNRDCAYAIRSIRRKAQFATHAIEGDIVGAYNNVNHKKLMKFLSYRIKDKKFLKLIWTCLKSGILQDLTFTDSYIGVPQGGITSPILFNIYMHEFDLYMLELIQNTESTLAIGPKVTSRYSTLKSSQSRQKKKLKKYEDFLLLSDEELALAKPPLPLMRDLIAIVYKEPTKFPELRWAKKNSSDLYIQSQNIKDRLGSPSNTTEKNAYSKERTETRRAMIKDPSLRRRIITAYIPFLKNELNITVLKKLDTPYLNKTEIPPRIYYHRYADDFTVWIRGTHELPITIKEKIAQFLSTELHLELSPEKTFITNILKEKVRFLGFEIYQNKNTRITRDKNNNLRNIRTLQINPDEKRLETKFLLKGFIQKKNGEFIPREIGWLTPHTDHQIIKRYNEIIIGLSDFLVTEITNISSINRWIYYLYYSCIKTLATKHKISVRTVIERFGYKDLSILKPLPRNKTLATDLRITSKIETIGKPTTYRTLLNYKETLYTLAIPHRNRYLEKIFSKKPPLLTNPIDFNIMHKINSRTQFKMTTQCTVCGAGPPLASHHIRHLKVKTVLGSGFRGFDKIVAALNRKQIPVCLPCHKNIHDGKYDSISLNDLYDARIAISEIYIAKNQNSTETPKSSNEIKPEIVYSDKKKTYFNRLYSNNLKTLQSL